MEDFVTYEQSQKLKELGFDWKCFAYYLYSNEISFAETAPKDYNYIVCNDHISAPSLAQAAKWLREVKNIIIIIEPMYAKNGIAFNYAIFTFKDKPITLEHNFKAYSSYEKALSTGIDKAIEILTDKTEKK